MTVLTGGGLQIDGARVIRADIVAMNGVLPSVDRLMIPPGALRGTNPRMGTVADRYWPIALVVKLLAK